MNQFLQRRRVLALLLILMLALLVRGLTAQFIGAHLTDAGWFPYGIYSIFDRHAQNILDGRASVLWIDDAAQTDAAVYPPGYPLWLACVYFARGARSASVVQGVQWVLDSFAVWLIAGLGVTAYGWRAGLAAGALAALSPLLALYGATPLADAPTSWIVLGGAWMLLLSAKRENILFALCAGLLVGASCWLRANALLLAVWWALALLYCWRGSWRRKSFAAAVVLCGTLLIVTPVIVRNAVAFHAFVPTGLGVGTNLWEGIGETTRAAEFGAVYGDANLLEQERAAMNLPPGAPLKLYWPDGVERDRERTRKAFAVIAAHPVWYAGVMARRAGGVLKFAGEPLPIYGSAGINVTSRKCLPPERQGGIIALCVNLLGMLQSVLRYVALPLMLCGVWFALRRDARMTALILTTILYYLVVGSFMHTEIRYGLPMQSLLFIFAGITIEKVLERGVSSLKLKRKTIFASSSQ
jgi:hypothetical protein